MNLREVLHPMSAEEFFGEYWEKRPVIIRGRRGRFQSLFGRRDIGSLLHYLKPKPPSGMLLVKGSKHSDVNWLHPDGTPRLDKVREAWRDGYSIVINDLGKLWAPVADLAAAMHEELHHTVDCNLYLTPVSSQAFVPHFDIMDVLVLQIEGSKVWQVRGAAADLPLDDEQRDVPAERLPPIEFEETLEDGSVLYLPRGFVHAARATEQPSLHLTFGVNIVRWIDLLTAAVSAARTDSRFRRALPPGFLHGSDEMATAFTAMLEDLPRHASFDHALAQLADRIVVGHPTPPNGDLTDNDPELALETMVARRHGVICRALAGPGYAGIQYSGGKMVGPPKIAAAVQMVIGSECAFPVRAMAGELSEKETLVLARRLVRDGVLTIAG